MRATLLLIAAVALTAADPAWKGKPISQWTAEDAKEVLTNSPWAKPTTAATLRKLSEDQLRDAGRMGGGATHFGIGRPPEEPAAAGGGAQRALVEVRWESALPVRAAEVKAGEIGAPDWEGNYYVIALYDVPGVTSALQKNPGMLKQTTFLKCQGKKDLKPARVEITPLPAGLARIVFLFPRSAQLTISDARVEFVSQIGRIWVAQFFETEEMQFASKLEL